MDKARAGYIEGIVSIFVNLALFTAKIWVGIITGSIALTADAWHTLSDSLSSVVVIISIKLSSRKADREHPFGHGRWEQISAIFIGFILAIIAYDFLREAVIRFQSREGTVFGPAAVAVTIVSIVVKEALAQYAFYVGRKTDNVTVKADGWHHRTDALSSVVVLAGIFLASRFWWIDSILGGIIALMLFYATYEIVKEAIGKLLGELPDKALTGKVESIIRDLYGNHLEAHHYHIHNYVSHQELTFHIKLDNSLNISEGHKIATDIENKIYQGLGITATVHIEPRGFKHKSD